MTGTSLICPTCKHWDLQPAVFCHKDGSRLVPYVCPSCGYDRCLQYRFCKKCGVRFEETE